MYFHSQQAKLRQLVAVYARQCGDPASHPRTTPYDLCRKYNGHRNDQNIIVLETLRQLLPLSRKADLVIILGFITIGLCDII